MNPVNIIRALIASAAIVIMFGVGLLWATGDATAERAWVAGHCIDYRLSPPTITDCPDPVIPPTPKLVSHGPGEDNAADPVPTYTPAPAPRKALPTVAPKATTPAPTPDTDATDTTDTEGSN